MCVLTVLTEMERVAAISFYVSRDGSSRSTAAAARTGLLRGMPVGEVLVLRGHDDLGSTLLQA